MGTTTWRQAAFDFTGTVALVTGGASGIGLQVARDFVAAGGRVAINDLDPARAEAAAAGLGAGAAMAVPGDVTDPEAVRALVGRVMSAWGRIDHLVNSAGIADEVRPTLEQDIDTWQRVLDISLRGSYLVSREAGRHMIAAGSGAIVGLSSVAGVVGLPGRNAYSAAKAGIAMMTRTLAAEWGGTGVRVNAVAPGYIDTPLLDGLKARGRIGLDPICRRTPMGRLGRPAEVSGAILFLCSDAASYVTGVTLPVDGGWCAFGGIPPLPEAEAEPAP